MASILTTVPDAMSSLGTSTSTSSDVAPSISVLTITVAALTTAFTPPGSCNKMDLTQLSSPGYQIWLNEPQPVPESKFGDCYPPGFIDEYTSITNASSSIAPMFSPLVCPEGWTTAMNRPNGYIACCISGFLLHAPDTTVDTNRPAYGGTCYSNFALGQTINVTQYDSAHATATAEWIASASTDQAYAHIIDGFRLGLADNTPSPTTTSDPFTSAAATTESSFSLTGGAIAGAVVGSVAGFALILLALSFLFRRYRKKRDVSLGTGAFQQQQQQYGDPQAWNKEQVNSPSTNHTCVCSYGYSTTGAAGDGRNPFPSDQRYELGEREPGEMDAGTEQPKQELDGRLVGHEAPW
ncbi:hypothetical protein F4779DRAFT_561595 [Xylariaceae sp. FL0662B]|nr:hypothetical protein F4779DRAFT_561595 [Xylariaceae sp. FL0662B]